MRLTLIIITVALLLIACFELQKWHEADRLKPNVSPGTYPKWLFDSGYRIDFDARESLVISNWITTHQTGWKPGSGADLNPFKTQLLSDACVLEIDTNIIVFQYYNHNNDPSGSFTIIKR